MSLCLHAVCFFAEFLDVCNCVHGGSVFNRFNASKIFPSPEDRHSLKVRDVLVCWVSALEVYRRLYFACLSHLCAHLCTSLIAPNNSKYLCLFKSKVDSVALFSWICWAVAHSAKPCNRACSVWCSGVC